jgi:hypothetical protein
MLIGVCIGLEARVAHSTTINVVVDAPRVVKRVRRRQVIFEDEVETAEGELCHFCLKDNRRLSAVAKFRYKPDGVIFPLCSFHAEEQASNPKWEAMT